MIYLLNLLDKITIKRATKALLMSVVLSNVLAHVQATTIPNGIEMGLALATVPFDSAAHHYDLKDKKKTAALLHLTTDTISILNKLFFFGNNIKDQGMNGFTNIDRDCVVNAAWLARDITRLYQHLQTYRTAQNAVDIEQEEVVIQDKNPALEEDEAFLSIDEQSAILQQLEPAKISRLAYLCQVIVIPSLRGLTAGLLAWSQDDSSSDLNSSYGRFLATSAHSLVRLSQEYGELDSDSSYKKMLVGAALIANTVWLVKELKNYQGYKGSEQAFNDKHERRERRINRRVDALLAMRQEIQEQNGDCTVCLEEGVALVRLSCGHADTCRNCLIGSIGQDLDKMDKDDCPRCPHMDVAGRCNAPVFTDIDIRNIVGNDRALLRRFILTQVPPEKINLPCCGRCFLQHPAAIACNDAKMLVTPDELATANELVRVGAKKCPNVGCGVPIIRQDGCNHVRCLQCNHGFCWQCLAHLPQHVFDRNEIQPCGCNLWARG